HRDALAPIERHAHGLQAKICCSCSWLHFLKGWSLLKTRCDSELPRVELVIDVPEDERQCPCGTPMVRIGEDVSEQLDIVPMQIRVIRTVRPRYACPKGDQAPVQPPAPAQIL